MVNINDYCIARSLGEKKDVPDDQWPRIPEYYMMNMKLTYRDEPAASRTYMTPTIKDLVLLGSLPHDSRIFLVLQSASRSNVLSEHTDDPVLLLPSLSTWLFQPPTQTLQFVSDAMPVAYSFWQTLVRATTAFVNGPEHTCIQVLAFSHDPASAEGRIEIRQISNQRSSGFASCSKIQCATVEAASAKTCFSRSQYYTATLLATRCIFYLRDKDLIIPSGHAYWTSDVESNDNEESPGVRIFELDIFIEKLMYSQREPFGQGRPAEWKYAAIFDPRPRDQLLGLMKSTQTNRGHQICADRVISLIVGVMADDHRSILLATVVVDPLIDNSAQRDALVLDAKKWKLPNTENTPEHFERAMKRVFWQGLNVTYESGHDCKRICKEVNAHNDTVVMAEYEPDGNPVQTIETDYWTISGKGWKGFRHEE